MSEVAIVAESRNEFGKGGARRARRAGKIPAVLYGHGHQPLHVNVPAREFAQAMKSGGSNALLSLKLSDGIQLALPKSIQRDPIKGTIEHVDLLIVISGEQVTVDIPVTITGTAAPSTMIHQETSTVSVEAEATHIPESLEVSVEGLEAGSQILAGDVPLPQGSTLATPADVLIVSVNVASTAAQLSGEEAVAAVETPAETE